MAKRKAPRAKAKSKRAAKKRPKAAKKKTAAKKKIAKRRVAKKKAGGKAGKLKKRGRNPSRASSKGGRKSSKAAPKKKPARRSKGPVFSAIAVDVGASNGRAVLGSLSADGVLLLRDVRRFRNGMHEDDGTLRWDFERLQSEIAGAVDDCFASGAKPASIGIDTWGVDYALVDRNRALIDKPFAYRDHRTDGLVERFAEEVMPDDELFRITGNHPSQINTLYQLYAEILSGTERLARADKLLMMPDALACSLSGRAVAEYTIASTSHLMDSRSRTWSDELIGRLGLRRELLPEIVDPGTKTGAYRTPSRKRINVVLPAGHDTASAVAAVPATGDEPWAFVSSGTWSVIGVEVAEPVLGEEAREAGVTNEGSLDGRYRCLSNVIGLWLIQECMRVWAQDGSPVEIESVCRDAGRAPVHGPLIDPDHPSFLAPSNMPQAIGDYCRSTGQPAPGGVGVTARCVFESLALKSRVVIERIAGLTGVEPKVIHMVGGGSRNTALCRMTADATGIPVVAGPAEATAAGNLLIQARTAGKIRTLADIREVSRNSFDLTRYEPSGDAYWRSRYERFRELVP